MISRVSPWLSQAAVSGNPFGKLSKLHLQSGLVSCPCYSHWLASPEHQHLGSQELSSNV